ncbi:MAG: hypothetical protein HY057_05300 [Rhodospirillales bacterium]|nr:hypothetical protein [Rhodospirillales bacterium]
MRPGLSALAVCSALALAACETTSDDPNRGGYFGGVGGLSGQYQRNIDERKRALENEQDKNLALERAATRREQEAAAVQKQLAEAQTQLAALDRDVAELKKKLAEARRKAGADTARLTQMQRQVAELEAAIEREKLGFGNEAERARQIEALRVRKKALEEEIARAVSR